MAGRIDYNALKAQTLDSGADEEAVTVSIRPLIDKVLARYSSEWTVLRELLQNAADASATKVTVRWETLPSSTVPVPQSGDPSAALKHTITNHTLKRLVVTNNGQPFNGNDWSRLKKIAEGNPDETKIGAFGVGFYSVFADCEEPFVSSGSEAMAFYWKGNALFTRKVKLPATEASADTSFVLDYRNDTSPVPTLLPLCQFLANSLTFVGLDQIELWLDDFKILDLHKKLAPAAEVPIPRDIETKTPEGLMRISRISREVAQIDGQWMNVASWRAPKSTSVTSRYETGHENTPSLRTFFSRLAGGAPTSQESLRQKPEPVKVEEDMTKVITSTVFLHITTATLSTSTSRSFAQELERATKKPPPKTTKIAILTASPESEGPQSVTKKTDVFATVLPTKSGRIFIGFPTHQTTGLGAHISAPSVIPTVERESIDLNARWVRSWNLELLRAAGTVCRIAWSLEMDSLKEQIRRRFPEQKKIRLEEVSSVLGPGVLLAQQYSFKESTPASQVGQVIEDAFWTCSKKASIDVLSTCGVLPTHEIRIAPKELSFMEGIPVIPEQMIKDAGTFVSRLTDFGLVTDVTVSDVKAALESNALTSKQLQEFVSWISTRAAKQEIDERTSKDLLAVAVANDEHPDGQTRLIMLGDIKYFLNPSKIPPELPVPPSTIPVKYTASLNKFDLESLGWQELQIVPWVRWLLEESQNRHLLPADKDLTSSPGFVGLVFPILSRQWDGLSQSSKTTIVELLSQQTVLPTKLGMRKPGEAYFPNVKIFDDLPVVQGLNSVKDKFLLALGVRKTLELNVVFDRLLDSPEPMDASVNSQRPGSHVELIKYLASVKDDIPAVDMQRLHKTPLCPAENTSEVSKAGAAGRYRVCELFEPRPQLRELGLRLLAWPGPYRAASPEGRFLSMLGLRNHPTVTELVEIMANATAAGNLQVRDKAMGYFLSNHHINGYASFDYSKITVPFLPLLSKTKLSTPSKCFTEEGAALLGYDILARELQPHASRFGIRTNPPMDHCIEILIKRPPGSSKEARQVFGYMSSRLGEISQSNAQRLGDARIIPVMNSRPQRSEKSSPIRHVAPVTCFLGQSDTYKDIFDFVDFGQEANAFLLKCGSKHEPTKLEVAKLLVREPARISSTFGDPEKYLGLLRNLADSLSVLKKDKELFRMMKSAPFLLASKELLAPATIGRAPKEAVEEMDDLEEDDAQGIKEWQLTSAQDAIIVDDYISYNLFRTSILCAPQEELLEDFYYSLGSPLLSSLVEEAAKHSAVLPDQKVALKLQKQIFERSRLFLHEQPADMIKHDTRWLEKNLTVQTVNSISMRRSLKGRNVSHVEKRSAVITHQNREYILWVTAGNIDIYQVSQALVHILLVRPKLHSALTLEMLLKTDLMELRNRGFNVARILRQKAAEARIAEEKRQQQLEEERHQIEEQERQWTEVQKKAPKEKNPEMPGVFPDSPDRPSSSTQMTNGDTSDIDPVRNARTPRGLFSTLTKRFGLEDKPGGRQSKLLPAPEMANGESPALPGAGNQPPPPYSQADPQIPKAPRPVTAPHQLHQNLLSAIQKSRPTSSTDVFSRGETNTVSETKSYCDEHPAHDLQFVAEGAHRIQIYLTAPSASSSSAFLSTNSAGLNVFATLLKDVASIFAMQTTSVNIFNDPGGKTIAFNRNGSIFCNYLYFQQLHESKLASLNSKSAEFSRERGEALVYWWVILCHELAHNLVGDHSSEHSYYTEAFVQRYFGKVMIMIAAAGMQVESNGVAPVEASRQLPERSLMD